jgi:hypothetical protein
MGIKINKKKIQYLNYFQLLEENLEVIFRYIEPEGENMKTYSLENARLYLSICSEIDILFKELLSAPELENINQYRKGIEAKQYFEKFYSQEVNIVKYGITAKSPWINFKDHKSPDWWKSYNNVKHSRLKNFEEANLENIINALCGLFILVCFYISDDVENIGKYNNDLDYIDDETFLCKLES